MTDVVAPNLIFPALDLALPRVSRQGQRGPRPGELDWTEERIGLLTSLHADGLQQTEIADAMGLTVGQVSGKLSRLGLKRERQTSAPRRAVPRQPRPQQIVLPTGKLTFDQMAERSREVCHFPVGDVPNLMFCGDPTSKGDTYCASCAAIAYRNPNDFRERRTFAMPI